MAKRYGASIGVLYAPKRPEVKQEVPKPKPVVEKPAPVKVEEKK